MNGDSPNVTEPQSGLSVETNSIGMKMVLIPAGEFTMGDQMGNRNEKPAHKVRITSPFYLGQHEVTVGQFRKFVEDSKYVPGTDRWQSEFSGFPGDAGLAVALEESFLQTDEHPAVFVSWNDAKAFCEWLSKKEGKKSRLPTEAEWEYACRAGTQTRWSFGDNHREIGDYAWIKGNSRGHRQPVGQKKPNPWGLYDMHGNVWEWCADWYRDSYLPVSSPILIRTHDPKGPSSGENRVLRGGSWRQHEGAALSAFRTSEECPGRVDETYGFRAARNA